MLAFEGVSEQIVNLTQSRRGGRALTKKFRNSSLEKDSG